MSQAQVIITRRGAERARDGHLWVYRSDVRDVGEAVGGAVVRVRDERGRARRAGSLQRPLRDRAASADVARRGDRPRVVARAPACGRGAARGAGARGRRLPPRLLGGRPAAVAHRGQVRRRARRADALAGDGRAEGRCSPSCSSKSSRRARSSSATTCACARSKVCRRRRACSTARSRASWKSRSTACASASRRSAGRRPARSSTSARTTRPRAPTRGVARSTASPSTAASR